MCSSWQYVVHIGWGLTRGMNTENGKKMTKMADKFICIFMAIVTSVMTYIACDMVYKSHCRHKEDK